MSEGWSDFFALLFTQDDQPELPRGLFTFWRAEPPGGPGARSVCFSTDPQINPLTFEDYNRRRCIGPAGGSNPQCSSATCLQVSWCDADHAFLQYNHAIGEIWASALWDLYWKLAARYGRSNDLYRSPFGANAGGENIALQLVVDGLKLQTANPTFLQARDGILLADSLAFDVADPSNPCFVRSIDTSPHGGLRVHQCTVEGGRLYACDPQAGKVHIFDVSAVGSSAPHIASFASGASTHSAWPTAGDSFLVVCKEPMANPWAGNIVDIWDLRNLPQVPQAPSATITLPLGEAVTAHNPMVAGDILYVSWYQAGLLAFDLRNPLAPVQIARHDTYPGSVSDFTGNWGVYSGLGPDRILASDTVSGLFILSNSKSHRVTIDPVGGPLVVEGLDFGIVETTASCP